MTIKCKNCIYWREKTLTVYDKDMEPHPAVSGECLNDKLIYWKGMTPPIGDGDTLFFRDFEDYYAEFYVGPEFGCIHGKREG